MIRASVPLLSASLAVSFFSALATAQDAKQATYKPLTVEDIYSHGSLSGNPPEELSWSPDGKHLTYIDDGQLMDVNPATAKPEPLINREKLAPLIKGGGSEQDRDHRARYSEASYFWSPDSAHLLFDTDGYLWLYDLKSSAGVQIGNTGTASEDDPKFSPDGHSVSFIHDHGLEVIRLRNSGQTTIKLAPAPNPETLEGEVDWVYLEELDVRSNYFWSPDSKSIAFLEMDESQVPKYPITDWIPTHATVDEQYYPQPGDPNPAVRVGVVGINGGRVSWVKLPIAAGQDYVPRFGWVDEKTLWIETVTRDHKHRDIYFAEPAKGAVRQVLEIKDDKYVDENYEVDLGEGHIVLTNWTDGHNHLYLYKYDQHRPLDSAATLEKQLTQGEFEVGEVSRVDFKSRFVDFASNEGNVEEQQLWQVSFDGKHVPLTAAPGFHAGSFSPAGSAFIDRHSTRMNPTTVDLCQSPGKCAAIFNPPSLDEYRLRAPIDLTVKAHDGTTLYATLLLPDGAGSPASVPLIVNPYGGPGPQTIQNHWTDEIFFDEILAQHGYAVLHADNRGMGMRGRKFAQACYRNFGPVQFEDQMTVVDSVLSQYPQLDPQRLGWWGWSWGGTFTLYALSHTNRFRAGVSVAPVTDWRNYDSIYTERYMGLPTENADTYRDQSVVNSAAQLKGRLLICHGTGDDNVHIENTVQYVQKLIDAGIPYDLQIYPRKTHSIAGKEARIELFNRILAQFEMYLKPEAKE
ncbi:MAG TPA: alpha/beta fold hydrolase [Terracidiphilus sp.]|nr:alpha/beta fold hydrolase [Terracidiphilus sp.]